VTFGLTNNISGNYYAFTFLEMRRKPDFMEMEAGNSEAGIIGSSASSTKTLS
jgi:hypothetical protein